MSELRLPTHLVIAQAQVCRDALVAHLLGTSGEVRLDGSEVAECDTAGLQLLLSAARTAVATRRVLRIVHCSPALRRTLALAGVLKKLRVTSATPPEDAS
jgi:anti-anti-sigma regulatory factor